MKLSAVELAGCKVSYSSRLRMQATFKVIQKSLQAAGCSLQALLYGIQHNAQEALKPTMLPRRARIKPAIAKRRREVKTLQKPRLGACTVKWKRLYLEYAPSRFRPNFAHSWTRNMFHFQYGASKHHATMAGYVSTNFWPLALTVPKTSIT